MGLTDVLSTVDVGRLTSAIIPKISTRKALPIISAAAALLYTSYQLTSSYWKSRNSKYKEIPTPSEGRYPYVGHVFTLGGEVQLEKKLMRWHKQLGPIINLQFGVQSWMFISDPILAHKIFVVNGAKSSGRPTFVFRENYYSHGKGVAFSQNDGGWKKARTGVMSLITQQKIDELEEQVRFESVQLLERILHKVDSGEAEFFPKHEIQLGTINLAFLICFGNRYDSYEDVNCKAFMDVIDEHFDFEDLIYEIPNFLPVLYYPLHYLLGASKMKEWIKKFKKVASFNLREAVARGHDDILQITPNLPEDERLVLIGDIIGATSDTSVISTLSIMKLMALHTEVQSKAAEEIAKFISSNGRLPKFDEREQLPYCISVIKECLRMKAVVPFGVPHAATENIEVDGYLIPKGTILLPSNYVMHRDPTIFPDEPEAFKPERYMNDLRTMQALANGKPEERDTYSFGWGRRKCPGAHLGEMNLFFMFTTLLSKVQIEPASSGLFDIDADKKEPFYVKFSRRSTGSTSSSSS